VICDADSDVPRSYRDSYRATLRIVSDYEQNSICRRLTQSGLKLPNYGLTPYLMWREHSDVLKHANQFYPRKRAGYVRIGSPVRKRTIVNVNRALYTNLESVCLQRTRLRLGRSSCEELKTWQSNRSGRTALRLIMDVPLDVVCDMCNYLPAMSKARMRAVCKGLRNWLDWPRGDARSWWGVADITLYVRDDVFCIESLRWLHATFTITSIDVEKDRKRALHLSFMRGRLEVAEWLIKTFSATRPGVFAGEWNAFFTVCTRGQLALAKLFVRKFGVSQGEIRSNECLIFQCICEGGHLETAKWFADEFAITAQEAKEHHNWAFLQACIHGHLAVAWWLMETFGIGHEDRDRGFSMYRRHPDNSRPQNDVLAAPYPVTPGRLVMRAKPPRHFAMGLRANNWFVFRRACENGHLAVARWLAGMFDIARNEIHSVSLIRRVLANGHLDVAEWLEAKFGITREMDPNVSARPCVLSVNIFAKTGCLWSQYDIDKLIHFHDRLSYDMWAKYFERSPAAVSAKIIQLKTSGHI
jgi:hypothetical protein